MLKSALFYSSTALVIIVSILVTAGEDARFTFEHNFGLYGWFGGELEEIKIWGIYIRESEEEIRDAEEDLKWYLEEGESVLEKFAHMGLGKERYGHSGQRFCRHVTGEGTKNEHPAINPNLQVRLYDKAGKVLSKDFLRDEFPENTKRSFPNNTEEMAYQWHVIAYVPYHKEGDTLKLVRLQNGREILLEQLEFHSLERLMQEIEEGKFYAYIPTADGCFLSPPMR